MKKYLLIAAAVAAVASVSAFAQHTDQRFPVSQSVAKPTATPIKLPDGVAYNGACSPNGLIAENRDGSGQVLGCQHGKWLSLSDSGNHDQSARGVRTAGKAVPISTAGSPSSKKECSLRGVSITGNANITCTQ